MTKYEIIIMSSISISSFLIIFRVVLSCYICDKNYCYKYSKFKYLCLIEFVLFSFLFILSVVMIFVGISNIKFYFYKKNVLLYSVTFFVLMNFIIYLMSSFLIKKIEK